MHKSRILAVRSRGVFSFFNKDKPATKPAQQTREEEEKLRTALSKLRTDAPRSRRDDVEAVDTEDIIDQQIDMDSIRARSLLQYRYNYSPPDNISDIVLKEAEAIVGERSSGELTSYTLNEASIKFKLLTVVGNKLKHFPHNSRLLQLKTVQDVVDFYSQPVQNINSYSKLARSNNLPENVHIMEQPHRFHPEDTEAWHGGVTAFPGSGGKVIGLRNKRLLRQFEPKKEWYDYEDQNFDYTRPDKDMPWDPEIVKRMDRYPDKRYNLRTKTFIRTSS